MTPSGQDIQLKFNPESIIANFRKVERAAAAAMKAIGEGSKDAGARVEKFSKELGQFSQGVATFTDRAKQSQERYIQSLEKTANALGKTRDSATISWLNEYTKGLGSNEKAIARVNAVKQKWVEYEKSQGAKAMENEIKALEKRAALYGKSGIERMQSEMQEQIKLHEGNAEAIKRVTAAYGQMIAAEKQEVAVAREREVVAIQRRGAMAGMSPSQRLQATQAEELAKSGGDPRVALAHEQEIAAAVKQTAEAREQEIQALERRGELIGKGNIERLEIEKARALKEYNNDQRVALYYDKQIIAERQKETQAVEKNIQALERRAAVQGLRGEARLRAELAEEIKLYNGDATAIARVTEAYEKMIVAEKASGHGGGGTGNLIFRGIRDLFEGRTAYGSMDLGRAFAGMAGGGEAAAGGAGGMGMLAGIPATTMAMTGLTAAFAGFEVAGFKAAEAVGEFAEQIHRTQIITGMSAEDVQRFDYVAKATGTDVSMITRMMRPLAQALNESGAGAQKAREQLRAYGVDLYGMATGTLKEKDLLLQLGAALEANDSALLRDKGMIDILKKAGIEAGPMLVEMKEQFREASGISVMSGADVKKYDELHKNLIQMKTEMEQIKEATLGWFADLWVNFNKNVIPNFPQLKPPPELKPEDMSKLGPQAFSGQQRLGLYGSLLEGGAGSDKFKGIAIGLTHEDYIKNLRQTDTEAAREWANNQKRIFDEYLQDTSTKTVQEVLKQKDAYMAAEAHAKALETADRNRLAINEALTRAALLKEQREENPFLLPAQAELNRNLRLPGITPQQAAQFRGLYGPQITFEQTQQTSKFQQQMLEVQQTTEREMARARMGGIEPVNIRELGQGGVTRADVERDIVSQYQQRVEIAKETRNIEEGLINKRQIDARDNVGLAQKSRDLEAATGKEQVADAEAAMAIKREAAALSQRERDLAREHAETMSKIQLADQEEGIRHAADLARKSAELRFKGDSPAAGIAEDYRISVQLAQELYDNEMERIKLHEFGYKKDEDAATALHKLHREDEAASEEAQFKLMEMQQKQLDTLKGKIEPLYHTLFTDPKNFGKQLRSTVTEAALHPIVSGLSEMTAKALYPTIYGATGTGGIAGAFGSLFGGGRLNDVKLVNGAVPVYLTGGGGGGVTSSYSPGGGYWGGGGTGGWGGGGGGGPMSMDQILSLPTRTYGGILPGLVSWGGGGGGGTGGAGRSFGGFGSGTVAGSRGGLNLLGLKALKGSFMPESYTGLGGEKIFTGAGSTFGENLGGALSSQAAAQLYLGAGMPLAMAGITGTRRGTAGGTVESMLGGAGVGAGIGTMILPGLGTAIGAGVGAAAGLGIGIGEMIAGVESQRNEAKRLVQSVYHIGINNTTADQIVSMANQSYGGSVSVAVRSPDVRHMLGLYAAGTGQANTFTMGSGDPHGASLVESGGVLSQQATYQYGQAYSQSSNLPVYGGTPTHTLGAPGGGMSLSLNIGGQDAAKFMTGQVVTPDVVQTQYAAAMNNSNGRVAQALMMSEPGSIQA